MSPDLTSSVTSSPLANEFISRLREYLGTPWKHRGRSKRGIDCIGLPLVVGRDMGLHQYQDDYEYGREARNFDMLTALKAYGVVVGSLSVARDGDLLVFKIPLFPQHVGVLSRVGATRTLIHASVDARKVVEETLSSDVERNIISVIRFKGLA